MALNPRVAVIGAGNLGTALIAGLLEAGVVAPAELTATVTTPQRAEALRRQFSIQAAAGEGINAEAARGAGVIILGVKPGKVTEVLGELREILQPEQVLVSMAAAVPLEMIEQCLLRPMPVIRVMPNIAMRVRQSATAICPNTVASDVHRQVVEQIFATVGSVVVVQEEMMHAVTALSGSGPGYVYLVIEALVAGGVQMGLPPEVASQLARQTLLGAAQLASHTGVDPAELRERVTTPGGTTAAGLDELEARGLRAALVAAVEAATERSEALTRGLVKGA